MQKRISILIITVALAISAAAQVGAIDPNRPDRGHDSEQEHEKKQKYTCLMHPEVITDHPGNCPKCGMTLVPKEAKRHSTLNSDKSRAGTQRATSNHQSHLPHQSQSMHEHEMQPPSHEGHAMQMEMHSSIDLADPMSREGSGTSWLPDSSPMYGKMFMFGDDMLMLHGAIFPRYTNVSTTTRRRPHRCAQLDHGHVFASARRQHADRRAT